MQSDIIDLTTEDEDFNLELEPNKGWKGGNQNFRVLGNVIKIKQSDGNATIVPTEPQRRKMYDLFGNYSQHVQIGPRDHVFQLWMSKIGPYLADWVLDKRHSNDQTALTIPWKLIGFPAGYTLWVHLTGDHADPANPRTDAYLYGSPGKIFRSPMEFVEHAIWLMRGRTTPTCLCKYCTPGQNQRAINRRLNHGGTGSGDDDGAADDDAAPHIPAVDLNATRHPLFRDRPGAGAAAAAAAAARRRGKREKSPGRIIMAKDYRTPGAGGAGAGAGAGGAGGLTA